MTQEKKIKQIKTTPTIFKSSFIVGISLLICIYTVLSIIIFPTPFIGGTGTLNFGLIATPLVGILCATWLSSYCNSEKEELIGAIIIGGFGGFVASFVSPANFCGLYFIMLPLFGVIGTVLTYKGGKFTIIPLIWIISIAIGMFATFHLLLINIPHLIAIGAAILAIFKVSNYIKNKKLQIGLQIVLACIVGTITEWCALNIFAAWVLQIPTTAWYTIMPLVFFERGIAVCISFPIAYSVLLALHSQKIIDIYNL